MLELIHLPVLGCLTVSIAGFSPLFPLAFGIINYYKEEINRIDKNYFLGFILPGTLIGLNLTLIFNCIICN